MQIIALKARCNPPLFRRRDKEIGTVETLDVLLFNNFDKLEIDFRASIYHVIYEHVSCERPSRYVKLLNTLVDKNGLADQFQQNAFLDFFFVREYNHNGIVLVPRVHLVRENGHLMDLKLFWDPCCAFRRQAVHSKDEKEDDDLEGPHRRRHPFPWVVKPTWSLSQGHEVIADDIGQTDLEPFFLLSSFHSDNNILAREYWEEKGEIEKQWQRFNSKDDESSNNTQQKEIKDDWFYNEKSNYIAYLCQMYFLVAKLCACRNSSSRLFFSTNNVSTSKKQKGFLRQICGTPNPGILPFTDVSGYEKVIFPLNMTTVSTIPRALQNSDSTAGFWVGYPCSHQMYYEVTIVKATAFSYVQLGWTLFPNEEFTYNRAAGVGSNSYSWSCDGIQKQKKGAPKGSLFRFHGGKQYSAIDLAQPWQQGDTIGCLVDLNAKKMYCICTQAGVTKAIVIFSDADGFPEAQNPSVQLHPAISGINATLHVNFGIDKGKQFIFSDKSLMTNLKKPTLDLPIQKPVFAWGDGQSVIPSFEDLTDIVFCERLPPCIRAACNMLLKEIYFDQAPMHSEHLIEKTKVFPVPLTSHDHQLPSITKSDTVARADALNVSGDIEMSPTNLESIQLQIGDAQSALKGPDIDVKFEISLFVQRALVVLSGEEDLLYCLVQNHEDDAKSFLIHLISCIKHFLTFRSAFPADMLEKIEPHIEATCNLYFEVVRRAKKTPQPHATEEEATNSHEYKNHFKAAPGPATPVPHRPGSTHKERAALDKQKPWILGDPVLAIPAGSDQKLQNWHSAFDHGLSGPLLIQICQLLSFGWDIKYASILAEAFRIAAAGAPVTQLKVGNQQPSEQLSQQVLQLVKRFSSGENFLEHSLDVAELSHSGVRTSMFGLINRYFTSKPKLLQLFDELQILDHPHEIEGFNNAQKYLGVLDSSVQWLRHCLVDPTSLEWDNVPNVFSNRLGELWNAIESLIALCTTENDFDENVALMSSWVAPDVSILFMQLDETISRDGIEPYEPTREQLKLPNPKTKSSTLNTPTPPNKIQNFIKIFFPALTFPPPFSI